MGSPYAGFSCRDSTRTAHFSPSIPGYLPHGKMLPIRIDVPRPASRQRDPDNDQPSRSLNEDLRTLRQDGPDIERWRVHPIASQPRRSARPGARRADVFHPYGVVRSCVPTGSIAIDLRPGCTSGHSRRVIGRQTRSRRRCETEFRARGARRWGLAPATISGVTG